MSLRVAYICADRGVPVSGRGGSSTHVREFASGLVGRGVPVTLLAACPPDGLGRDQAPCPVVDLSSDPLLHDLRGRIARQLRTNGHESTRAAEIYSLMLNQTLLQELTKLRPQIDVVYERHSLWSFAGLQFARREGVPYFLEVNAPLTDQQQAYRDLDLRETAQGIEQLVFPAADRVILTSPALSTYARARGASQRRMRVIPCGVSRGFFPESGRAGTRDEREFVLGFVGSLKPWHGVGILLEAFQLLSQLSPSYRLLLVGDGPLLPYVKDFCRRHRLSPLVTLAGSVDHDRVPEYLARIDVGAAPYPALPSFYFSPLKIWEYAAGGVPIVASASGDLPRLFPHKSAALLHPPGSVRKIVKHVERLRQDRDLARRLARRARRIARLHTWDRLAGRFESLAAHVLAARRQPENHRD